MLFSAVTLVLIALISLFSFLLLVDTKMVVPGSFGGNVRFEVPILFSCSSCRYWRRHLWEMDAACNPDVNRHISTWICCSLHYFCSGKFTGADPIIPNVVILIK
jgi:hypothetical protein